MVMDILGVNYIPTMAFAPIDLDLSHSHSQMVEAAELVILCDMPIGPNNMKNLEVAKLAKQLVIFGQPELGDRDLTDGSASLLYQELKPIYMNSDLDSIVQKAGEIIRKTK
jgi:iron complex transport system ATP-binding protein